MPDPTVKPAKNSTVKPVLSPPPQTPCVPAGRRSQRRVPWRRRAGVSVATAVRAARDHDDPREWETGHGFFEHDDTLFNPIYSGVITIQFLCLARAPGARSRKPRSATAFPGKRAPSSLAGCAQHWPIVPNVCQRQPSILPNGRRHGPMAGGLRGQRGATRFQSPTIDVRRRKDAGQRALIASHGSHGPLIRRRPAERRTFRGACRPRGGGRSCLGPAQLFFSGGGRGGLKDE